MGATSTGNERVRAWVLLQAESAEGVAQALYKDLGHEGGDEFVVVRADIVAGPSEFAYNVIIPVDAENEDVLRGVVDRIREVSRVNPVIVTVDQHVPYPPHNAHGYITEYEAGGGKEEEPPIPAGRQGASPGFNAFG